MADYTRFEQIVREDEAAEREKKDRQRIERRVRYMKEQHAKQQAWLKEHPEEAERMQAEGGHGHSHGHGHGHGHGGGHGHSHGGGGVFGLPGHSCGFADPEQLKVAAAERAANHVPLEVKNAKKVRAIEATREHGKILFGEGKFEHAFAVYERGVLIANGCYGLDEEQQKYVTEMELVLDLNMAMCQLKLENWPKALSHCRMALQIDEKNVKARYRMALAYVGMADYDKAQAELDTALEMEPENKALHQLEQRIKALKARQKAKAKKYKKKLAEKMAARAKAEQE